MNSQEIVDYVMNTPSNTNPAILKQMIEANSSGGSGGGFDVVVARNPSDNSTVLLKGSYEELLAKFVAGEYPNVACLANIPGENPDFREIYFETVYGVCNNKERGRVEIFVGDSNAQGYILEADNSIRWWEYDG